MDDNQSDDIVISGYLYIPSQSFLKLKQSWSKKFFVLHKRSSSGIQRLELFENQESQLKKPNQLIKIIALNDCHKVSITTHKHQSNVFEIRTRESVHLLSTETYQQMQLWLDSLRSVAFDHNNTTTCPPPTSLTTASTTNATSTSSSSLATIQQQHPVNSKSIPGAIKLTVNGPSKERSLLTNGHSNDFTSSSVCILPDNHVQHQPQQEENMLYSSVDSPDLFSCKLIESESTIRCKLLPIDYYLLLTSVSISLAEQLPDTRQGKILWTWPYRHIRRYGCTKEGFSLEAGRKCLTGEGLFTFVTADGSTIFKCVASHVTSLKTTSPNGIFPVPRTSSPNIVQSISCSTSASIPTTTVSVPSSISSPTDKVTIDRTKTVTKVSIVPSVSSSMSTLATQTPSEFKNKSIICTARPVIINNNNEGLHNSNQSTNGFNHHFVHQRSSSPKPPSLPTVPRPNQRESPTSSNSNKNLKKTSNCEKQLISNQNDKLSNSMVTVTINEKPSRPKESGSIMITSNNNININGYPLAVKPPRRSIRGLNCDDDKQLTIINQDGDENSIETIAIPVTIGDPLYEDPIFVSREELFGLKIDEDDNHYEIPVIVSNNQTSNHNNQGAINETQSKQITITTNGLPGDNNRRLQYNIKHHQQQQLNSTTHPILVNGGDGESGGKNPPQSEMTTNLINDKLPRIHPHSMSRLTSVIRSMFTGNLGNIVNPRSKQSVKLEKYHSQSSSSEGSYCSLSSGSGPTVVGESCRSLSLEKIKHQSSSSSSTSDTNESPYSEICDISIENNPSNQQSSSNVIMMMVDSGKSFQVDEGNYVNILPQVDDDNHHNQSSSNKSTSSTTTIVTNVNPDHYIQNDAEYALIMKRSVSCGKL